MEHFAQAQADPGAGLVRYRIRFSNGGGGAGSITGIGFAWIQMVWRSDWMAASNGISDVTFSLWNKRRDSLYYQCK